MGLYKFNDEKSRKQIAVSILHGSDVKQANADGLVKYLTKLSRLVGSRNEWELNELSFENDSLA